MVEVGTTTSTREGGRGEEGKEGGRKRGEGMDGKGRERERERGGGGGGGGGEGREGLSSFL